MDPFPGVLSIPATRHPYAYGLDSPLLYADPSGKFAPWLLAIGVGAGIGAIGGGVSYVLRNAGRPVSEYVHDRAFWQTVGVGFASGAVAGAVGWAVPALLPTSSLLGAMGVGALSGSLASGAGQVTTNLLMGCDPHSGLASAMISGGVTGGLAGGAGYAVRAVFGKSDVTVRRLRRGVSIRSNDGRLDVQAIDAPKAKVPDWLRGKVVPHYHRRPGIKWHRPWESRGGSFWDRF